ncbi:MAG: gluconate 2-dehydrogenase subunit 3 family protein [Gammaproteobacteria bacterium]|nr:gluconate 2-dehydrogenase subunit 3 family protein [Gammaproteobacteria bacterium]
MNQPITSDSPLNAVQRAIFDVVLDQLIPEDPTRQKPSAADVGVFEYILERYPESFEEIRRQLTELDAQASSSHQMRYTELNRELQDETLRQLHEQDRRFLLILALPAVECYYLDNRVMAAIGLPARAPYPEGFTVHRGDLSLLDPVRERGQIWRRT